MNYRQLIVNLIFIFIVNLFSTYRERRELGGRKGERERERQQVADGTERIVKAPPLAGQAGKERWIPHPRLRRDKQVRNDGGGRGVPASRVLAS